MIKKTTMLKVMLLCVFSLFGQEVNYKIQKKIYPSFKSDTIISNEKYYKGLSLIYEKEYAYNGWQVIDSIAYDKDMCFKVYQPNYDVANRKIKSYSYSYTDCYQGDYYLKDVLLFKDKFMILGDYYNDIQFSLINSDFKTTEGGEDYYFYEFKEPAAPSLFTNYGIPSGEKLTNLSVKRRGNLILGDEFDYINFNLKRKYFYKEGLLEKVHYVIWDKEKCIRKEFSEVYRYCLLD